MAQGGIPGAINEPRRPGCHIDTDGSRANKRQGCP